MQTKIMMNCQLSQTVTKGPARDIIIVIMTCVQQAGVSLGVRFFGSVRFGSSVPTLIRFQQNKGPIGS
jgi:hypothetical protein